MHHWNRSATFLLLLVFVACNVASGPTVDASQDGAADVVLTVDAHPVDTAVPPDDGAPDAAPVDVTLVEDTGEDATIDAMEDTAAEDTAGDVVDAASEDVSVDAATCEWREVAMCGGNTRIMDFCGEGRIARTLERCGGSTYEPDDAYRMYLVSGCPGRCPTYSTHTVWQRIECCPR